MTALYIILGILLFFAVLMICPVTIHVLYENEFSAKVTYLFLTYTLTPEKQEETEQSEEEEEEKQKEKSDDTKSRIQQMIEQKGLSGFISFMKELANIAVGAAKKLFKHLVISDLNVNITVATDDAAQTALDYSYVCAALYPAVSVIIGSCKCKKYHVKVNPDFDQNESEIYFYTKAYIKLFFIVSSALRALFSFLKVMKRAKTANNN